ncbi:hypothetical protein ACWC2K_06020 [Streptomyces chattanoogensis]
MSGTITEEQTETAQPERADDLDGVKPLPVWFFAFEGIAAAAFDLCKAWDKAWMVLIAFGALNIIVGLTVLRRRAKVVRAMLKNARSRKVLVGLIALRLGVHLLLAVLGAPITSTVGHVVAGAVMAAATVTLLWFDQRVAFRALGLTAQHQTTGLVSAHAEIPLVSGRKAPTVREVRGEMIP